MEPEEILLKEYEICEQDNAGNFQGYWTLAGIFIGVSSALLAGLIYGFISNSSLFKGIVFHNNLKISLVVGIIAFVMAVANLIILQKLWGWHKRILYNQSNNSRRMREIELHLGMSREWRIYAVKRWCDEFGDKQCYDSDEEIWQKIRPILMGSVDDSLINEINTIQKTIVYEIRHLFIDKIRGSYEPTSGKKHYPCILSVILSLWGIVILVSVFLIASFFAGWQWGMGAIVIIMMGFIIYYCIKKSSRNEIGHNDKKEPLSFKPLPWGTIFFSVWTTFRVIDSPAALMTVVTWFFLVLSGILLLSVFVRPLLPLFHKTLTRCFPSLRRIVSNQNINWFFITLVFFTSLLVFPTNIIMKWSALQERDVMISVIGLVLWIIAYLLVLMSILSRVAGRIIGGAFCVLITWSAINTLGSNLLAGWIMIGIGIVSIVIVIMKPKFWDWRQIV